ncbi:MAG: hypothetical protein HZY74_00970 [Brevundimonas sp.]|nr:MAG: hypothetical protein HZY74_00970 [Brevundimonas sp.]
MVGSAYDDHLTGNSADNQLQGAEGADVLSGGDGIDTLMGGDGDDVLNGGAGDDVVIADAGADTIIGGSGIDTVSYATSTSGVIARLDGGPGTGGLAQGDVLSDVEIIIGSNFADTLIGDGSDSQLSGGAGNDVLYGRGGSDTLAGGGGYDIAAYGGVRRGYTWTASSHQVSGGLDGGTDTLSGIEVLSFIDGQLSFHRDGMAAQVMRLYDSAFNRVPDAGGFEIVLDALEGGCAWRPCRRSSSTRSSSRTPMAACRTSSLSSRCI